jgi:hypothetical protein
MPFKSPGGVHLIICAASVASRLFLYGAATPPSQGGEYRHIPTLTPWLLHENPTKPTKLYSTYFPGREILRS